MPLQEDADKIKGNLVTIVSRVLKQYISGLIPLRNSILKHIRHIYTTEMSRKSEVVVLDVFMKNENKHADMIAIMSALQGHLGSNYNEERKVLSGGDLLTFEGEQKHMMCGNTLRERLQILEPVVEDWHCLVSLLGVSYNYFTCACTVEPQIRDHLR